LFQIKIARTYIHKKNNKQASKERLKINETTRAFEKKWKMGEQEEIFFCFPILIFSCNGQKNIFAKNILAFSQHIHSIQFMTVHIS
jgi:hypothetical protein